jgi:hypothetical protein
MARHGPACPHQGFQAVRKRLGPFDQEAQIIPQWFRRCHAFLHLPPGQFGSCAQAHDGRFRRRRCL